MTGASPPTYAFADHESALSQGVDCGSDALGPHLDGPGDIRLAQLAICRIKLHENSELDGCEFVRRQRRREQPCSSA